MNAPENHSGLPPTPPPNKRPLRPRDAATLVVHDLEGGQARVLMGRRRMDQVFLPGHYVFPGGRVDRSDARSAIASPLDPDNQANLMMGMGARASVLRAHALASAAVRETYEETGYLVGRPGRLPEFGRLVYFCRAVTPPGRPRRFDTRFFAVSRDAVSGPHSGGDGELEDIGWRTLDEVRSLKLPSITRLILEDIVLLLGAGVGGGRSAPGIAALTSAQPAGIPYYFQRNGVFQRVVMSRSAGAP